MIPYYDKIVIKPLEEKTIIKSQDTNLLEKGEVVAVGRDVTFVKVGDIVYFESYGCIKTADGEYVVTENGQVILGKHEHS